MEQAPRHAPTNRRNTSTSIAKMSISNVLHKTLFNKIPRSELCSTNTLPVHHLLVTSVCEEIPLQNNQSIRLGKQKKKGPSESATGRDRVVKMPNPYNNEFSCVRHMRQPHLTSKQESGHVCESGQVTWMNTGTWTHLVIRLGDTSESQILHKQDVQGNKTACGTVYEGLPRRF